MAITNKNRTAALAYFRTSSATNVGTDKDSEKRQRAAVESFAKRAGFQIVDAFRDEAVSGKDPIDGRQGFSALLFMTVSSDVASLFLATSQWCKTQLKGSRIASLARSDVVRGRVKANFSPKTC
jgi:Resolvase, N terminal domain